LRLSIDHSIVPLAGVVGAAELIAARHDIAVLRLADGRAEIGYAIAEALDIVAISNAMVPSRMGGAIAGVISIEGEQVEMLDIHWLFAAHADPNIGVVDMPICLLTGGETHWMAQFLRPVLESAGYKVVTEIKPGERATVALAMDDDDVIAQGNAPVVRLRSDAEPSGKGEDSIYRYDRDGLLAALARRRVVGRVSG
jgi:two-component system chemotaxis sensor kinase CheA